VEGMHNPRSLKTRPNRIRRVFSWIFLRDLRIKFYARWKEFIEEQAVDPDQPRGV
jgi:hypothetical protein